MSEKVTPRPWKTGNYEDYQPSVVFHEPADENESYVPVAQCVEPNDEANAELICRAVNSFDDLISALKAARYEVSRLAGSNLPPSADYWHKVSRVLRMVDDALSKADPNAQRETPQ